MTRTKAFIVLFITYYVFGADSRVRQSDYYTANPEEADFFWIPHKEPISQAEINEVFGIVVEKYPYWNQTREAGEVRHIFTTTDNQGPGSNSFAHPLKVGNLPDDWNPASGTRVVLFLMFNGLADGYDSSTKNCAVCFQKGKDIQMVTAQATCGPLCGYPLELPPPENIAACNARPDLGQFSAQMNASGNAQAVRALFKSPRPNLLFFGGHIDKTVNYKINGRYPLLLFNDTPGWPFL
eukprot:gene7046-8403_t